MRNSPLPRAVWVCLLIFAIVAGLYFAKDFLIPVAFAGILSMLLLPFCRFLERKGWNKGIAVATAELMFIAALLGIITLLIWQVSNLSADVGKMQERISGWTADLKQYVTENFDMSAQEQEKFIEEQQSSGGGQAATVAAGLVSSIFGALLDFVLVIVYIFLFLYFRGHIKSFILRVVAPAERGNAKQIIFQGSKVAQQYLFGLAMMVVSLWILYSIGLTIIGLNNPIFFAMICGTLEIVPFVGNVTGTLITMLMAVTQGGGSSMIIGILIIYAVVQFIQTYVLEPLLVGAEVNINPLFTILVLVAGELVWGIPGMVLAIPLLGIVKVICDHVPALHPYGFLIGENKKKGESKWKEKFKALFKGNKR